VISELLSTVRVDLIRRCCLYVGVPVLLSSAASSQEGSRNCKLLAAPLTITEDSIGRWSTRASIRNLRTQCPTARDTTLQTNPSTGRSYPGLVVSTPELTLVALQYQDSVLQADRSPDGWIISGTAEILLPDSVPITAPWSELWSRFGRVQASKGAVIVVRFCRIPRMLITLDVPRDRVRSSPAGLDLQTIPKGASIHHIFLMGDSLARSFRPCQ
jgi:hypothetical protein